MVCSLWRLSYLLRPRSQIYMMPKLMKKHLALFITCFSFFPFSSLAQEAVDPTRDWKVIETEHFEIIYDAREERLADHVADEAELAYDVITKFLHTEKPTKTPLVVEDTTDITNGYAVPLPYAQVHIYPALPTAVDSISEYESWVRELIRHEFTHIMNFEPTEGVMDVLRKIFGGIIRPAAMLPRWYTEGLAVEAESRFTNLGRGRSSIYGALVRADLEAGIWGQETIDRLADPGIPTWPRGLRPYAHGYFLMHELSELSGSTDIYGTLNHRYGGRFPFFINGPVEDIFGKDYIELLAEMYRRVGERGQKQLDAIRQFPVTPTNEFPQEGYSNFGAQISPDGLKLAFITSVPNEDQGIRVFERKSVNEPFPTTSPFPDQLTYADSIRQLTWKDPWTIIYDRADTWERYNEFFDLYEINIGTKKSKRLTEGLRAREATVGPKGELIFIQATGENTRLVFCPGDKICKEAQILVDPPFGHRLSSPRAAASGKVIYAHRDNRGYEWIETFDLNTQQITKLTIPKVGGSQNFPTWDPENPGAFFFTSNETGAMNIYWRKDISPVTSATKPIALTNTTTYITNPVFDPGTETLLFSRLTNEGLRLQSTSVAKAKAGSRIGVRSPAITPIEKYPNVDLPPEEAETKKNKNYNGLSYLLPRYWFPWVLFVPGGSILDVSTSVSDPLSHHIYGADVGYDSRANNWTEAIAYTNNSFPFAINTQFSNENYYVSGLRNNEHFTYAYLSTEHFIKGLSNDWTLGPIGEYFHADYPGSASENQTGVGGFFSYTHIDKVKDYKISPEKGGSVYASHIQYPQAWSTNGYGRTGLNTSLYWSRWLPARHAISLKTRSVYTPEQGSFLQGSSEGGAEVSFSPFISSFLARGYPVGEFIGWSLSSANFEYRFPLSYLYRGSGTAPFYQSAYHGALVFDALTLNGVFFDSQGGVQRTRYGTFYTTIGGEWRANWQLAYFLPLTFRVGYYYGLTSEAQGGPALYIGFGSVL